MGRLQAEAIAEMSIPLDTQIEWHLRANHYPPVSNTMVPVCIKAIELANDGDWSTWIDLPKGVLYREVPQAPVYAVVEKHHLEAWISESELY